MSALLIIWRKNEAMRCIFNWKKEEVECPQRSAIKDCSARCRHHPQYADDVRDSIAKRRCIFCGETPHLEHGPHHILPRAVKKAARWKGKRAKALRLNYRVPICGPCHRKVETLQAPLVLLLTHLRRDKKSTPIPPDFVNTMDSAYKRLVQSPVIKTS